MMDVTLIKGDGIGPEVVDAAVRCVQATGVKINWDEQLMGEDAIKKYDTPLPQKTLDSIRKNKVALKGPVTTPVGIGFRSVNVALRQKLDLYANVRPAKCYSGVARVCTGIDVVCVRENIEGLYAGIEFEKGSAETSDLIDFVKQKKNIVIRADSGISLKTHSVYGSTRIVGFAMEYAAKEGRKKVTAVHKANILKFSDGLFLDVARKTAAKYKAIDFEDKIVDNMAMQLVLKPEQYDVLVLPNLYGDIISDLCSGLVGGLGIAPSGNFGKNIAVFEPVHGSAPKYAGQNKVNPTSTILSAVMMLRHLGKVRAANRLEKAVTLVLEEKTHVTYDLLPKTPVGTKEMADAVITKLQHQNI
jgi:isocitrate dehydrogenase (NAD+)